MSELLSFLLISIFICLLFFFFPDDHNQRYKNFIEKIIMGLLLGGMIFMMVSVMTAIIRTYPIETITETYPIVRYADSSIIRNSIACYDNSEEIKCKPVLINISNDGNDSVVVYIEREIINDIPFLLDYVRTHKNTKKTFLVNIKPE